MRLSRANIPLASEDRTHSQAISTYPHNNLAPHFLPGFINLQHFCHSRWRNPVRLSKSGLKLQDDGRESIYYANPPRLELGGTGLVSTAHDYLRFCRMMLNGGTLDGVQILSPKTVAQFSLNYLPDGREFADMTLPGLFSGSTYAQVGFSLGCGVNVDIAKTRLPGSLGQYFWGGATASAFWIDPKEELAVVSMTQVIFSEARETLRRDLRTLVYSAMTESFA